MVLITTKQAKDGQATADISGYTGVEVTPTGPARRNERAGVCPVQKEYYEDAAAYEGYTGGVPGGKQTRCGGQGTDW